MDKFGLPIDSQGSLSRDHAGLMSSIMKNAARLNALLHAPTTVNTSGLAEEGTSPALTPQQIDPAHADCTAKIEFAREVLTVRHKNGVTLAVRG